MVVEVVSGSWLEHMDLKPTGPGSNIVGVIGSENLCQHCTSSLLPPQQKENNKNDMVLLRKEIWGFLFLRGCFLLVQLEI